MNDLRADPDRPPPFSWILFVGAYVLVFLAGMELGPSLMGARGWTRHDSWFLTEALLAVLGSTQLLRYFLKTRSALRGDGSDPSK